jgi:DNA helicase II / ATP-dependent DNA helicase PcrA
MASFKSISRRRPFEPDERQREAIEHVDGPMLVVAGAGTGKTSVLTQRIARLIREGRARPDEILAVTYTKNSAEEMRLRVAGELSGTDLTGLQATTFHDYCFAMLNRNGRGFGVVDDKDLWIMLRKRIPELNLNYFVRAANVGQFLLDLLEFLRRCQDELVGPDQYAAYLAKLECRELSIPRVSKSKDASGLSDEDVLGRCREISGVFSATEKMMREKNLGTFAHMITHAHDLLHQSESVLAAERKRTRFILVDEFQDANVAQIRILRRLAGDGQNVFAVGDPDQAIYRFRGASSAAFALFQHHFAGAKLVALEQNRRSTTAVLQSAFALIAKNPEAVSATRHSASRYQRSPLVSARDELAGREGKRVPNQPVEVVAALKTVECSDLVPTMRERKRQTRGEWRDFAVLYRQHSHRDEIAAELAEQGIPFSIENMDVMDTSEVRDLFACLGAVVSENDGASVFRVAALPQFTIDAEKLRAGMKKVPKDARKSGMASVLGELRGGAEVLGLLQSTRQEIAALDANSYQALEIIIRRFRLTRDSLPLQAVMKFVGEWEHKPLTETGKMAELLEYLEYFREARGGIFLPAEEGNAVRLMTAHTAKGLEFDHVFVLRANSGSFPQSFKEALVEFPRDLRDADTVIAGDDRVLQEQEERRLFYVAMTRARDSLTIYAKEGTGKDKTPAGFLRDLLKHPGLGNYLRQRPARGFQTDMFGAVGAPAAISRIGEWISRKPDTDLSKRLSASAVQRYETCPLQFKLEREWKLPADVPAALQFGAAMHRVLRAFYGSVLAERPLAEAALVEMLQADLASAGIQDKYQEKLYQQKGIEQIRGFLAACRRGPVPAVLHLEEPFEMSIGDTTLAGRIDRVDQLASGKVAIVDYKTGKPQTPEDADESLQLSIYALAARAKWGYEVDRLMFYNLTESSPVATRRSELQLQEAKLKVEEVAAKIAEGRFEAKTGFHCNWCPYRNLCPRTEKKFFRIAGNLAMDASSLGELPGKKLGDAFGVP